MRIGGKVAIVTGAASGIGLGIAQLFIKEGVKVVFNDINESAKAATASLLWTIVHGSSSS